MEPFIPNNKIIQAAKVIAAKIDKKYQEQQLSQPLVLVGVLNGAIMFMAELMKHLKVDCEIDFIQVSSYDGFFSKGKLKWHKKPTLNLNGRFVILIEDIIDTGLTMREVQSYLWTKHNPIHLEVCTLLVREGVMELPEYYGYLIPKDKFVIGFGLDINGVKRNSSDIYVKNVKPK